MADDFDAIAREIAESDDEEGYFDDDLEWANCPTPDCDFKVNLWAGAGLCSPCTARIIGAEDLQRRYDETHDADGIWTGTVAPFSVCADASKEKR